MYFEQDNIYHIYNMGNNSQKIFYSDDNYKYFLKKIRNEIKPFCEILAYCLMPNHFHFMISANSKSVDKVKSTGQQVLTRKIGSLLSSYTRAINIQRQLNGSLFRKKTNAKNLREFITYPVVKKEYVRICFDYIHQNPVNAGLVVKPEEWKFSSFQDYCEIRKETFINKDLALEVLNVDRDSFDFYLINEYNEKELGNIF